MCRRPLEITLSVAGWLLCAWFATADAQQRNPIDNDIHKQEGAINAARHGLSTASGEAKSAQAAAAKAHAQFERVKDQTQAVQKKVQEELDKDPTLVQARKQMEEKKANYEAAAAPVLEALKSRTDYANAVSARDVVVKKKAVVEAGGYGDRPTIAQEMLKAMAAVRQLETGACVSDPKAASARKVLDEAEARVRELCDRRDEAIKKDSRVATALRELESAKKDVAEADKKYQAELKQANDAKSKLASAEKHKHELENRKRQQQQQQNDKNKNKGKKK